MVRTRIMIWSNPVDPPYGGAELWLRRMIPALVAAGHQVQIIALPRGDGGAPDTMLLGAWLLTLTSAGFGGDKAALIGAVSQLRGAIKSFQPDRVLINGFDPRLMALAGLMGSALTMPVHTIAHHVAPESQSRRATPLDLLIRRSAHLLCFDDHVADWLEQTWLDRAVTQVPMAIPPLDAPRIAPPAHPHILFCGRLSAEKGPRDLVDAMPALLRHHPDARLTMAGSGQERAGLETQIAALGLEDAVRLIGQVETQAVGALIDSASLVAIPSHIEGFGMIALEAAWRGRPVVASDIGGLPSIVRHGETGLLVPPGDANALAAALSDLLAAPDRAETMGQAARQRAERWPTWRNHCDAVTRWAAGEATPERQAH